MSFGAGSSDLPCFGLQNQGKTGIEIQSSTLELINGLVSLVHNATMPEVAAEAMEALLVLHQPEKIENWNPESVINTFWDVRYGVGSCSGSNQVTGRILVHWNCKFPRSFMFDAFKGIVCTCASAISKVL